MKELRWSQEQSALLKEERGVSLMNWYRREILGIERNASREHQRIMLLRCGDICGSRRMFNQKSIIFLKNSFPPGFQSVNILKSILKEGPMRNIKLDTEEKELLGSH